MKATETFLDYLAVRGLVLDQEYQREAMRTLVQALMESEVCQLLEAAPYERNGSRRAYRNGYRASLWSTDQGDLSLQIPKLRKGSYYPGFLHGESTLRRLVEDAFVLGTGVDDLRDALASLNLARLSAQDLADIAERLADTVYNAQTRPLNEDYAFVLADLLDSPGKPWQQILLLLGIKPSGEAALLAHEVTSAADDWAWTDLLRRLRQRGLETVQVVISRDYPGLRTAVETVYADAVWQHQEHVLLRADGESPLVDAVSHLVLDSDSDYASGPQMQLMVNMAQNSVFMPFFALV